MYNFSSSFFGDELVWAALWLHKATNNVTFLNEAEEMYEKYELNKEELKTLSFDEKIVGIQVMFICVL